VREKVEENMDSCPRHSQRTAMLSDDRCRAAVRRASQRRSWAEDHVEPWVVVGTPGERYCQAQERCSSAASSLADSTPAVWASVRRASKVDTAGGAGVGGSRTVVCLSRGPPVPICSVTA
jgi:hypothetical protein